MVTSIKDFSGKLLNKLLMLSSNLATCRTHKSKFTQPQNGKKEIWALSWAVPGNPTIA
jgi:hypothetical protein